jgi:hypothetical protein
MMTMPATVPEPQLRVYHLPVENDGEPVVVSAYLLGTATSENPEHNDHDTEFVKRGERCSACRWFEVQIFDVSDDEDAGEAYLVYTVGKTIVPGETPRIRFKWTDSPRVVVESLTVRQNGHPKLPVASALALAMAADLDDEIARAFDRRVVA